MPFTMTANALAGADNIAYNNGISYISMYPVCNTKVILIGLLLLTFQIQKDECNSK